MDLCFNFTVSNVTKVIVAADAMGAQGYIGILDPSYPRLEKDGAPTIPLHRFGRTTWMRLRRGYSGHGPHAVVAPVTRAAPSEP